jgi:hypothetical protein
MYTLLNKLFGWDYIQWNNSIDQGVARVRKDGRGVIWYWRYRSICCADVIREPQQVLWLTCSPEKYFPNKADITKCDREE